MTGREDMDDLQEHVRSLHRFATGLVGNSSDAEDLVQECLRRVISQIDKGAEIRNIHAYLFQTLRNVHVDECRYRAGRGIVVPIDETIAEPLSAAPNQEDRIRCSDVSAALDQLPSHQREVVLLVCVEELSYEEAGEIIGQPIGTVRSRLHRGRAALHAILDAPEDMRGYGIPKTSHHLRLLGRAGNA